MTAATIRGSFAGHDGCSIGVGDPMRSWVSIAIVAAACGPASRTTVNPEPRPAAPSPEAPAGGLIWTVQIRDYQTKGLLAGVAVTAVEQTWSCKTRVVPRPPTQDHDHR